MSDTGQNRFEIDLDEIERQLRRSAELSPNSSAPPSDPLAELARIVGQDDPFLNILGETKRPGSDRDRREPTFESSPRPATGPAPRGQADALLTAEDRGVLGTAPLAADPVRDPVASEPFDPVARSYGSRDDVLDTDDFTPMPPPRSRRRLGAVMALVALTAVGAAGAYGWRNMGRDSASSGPPPLIRADNAPLKVAPENPGGMDIPNQNRQIFEGRTDPARSRVLDRQEQPIDVREAARQMPAVPDAPPSPAVPQTNATIGSAPASATPPVMAALPTTPMPVPGASTRPSDGVSVGSSPAPPARNPVLSALGEPRRVRTVAVRPDGSAIGGAGGLMMSDPNTPIMPTGQLPPAVSVPTVSIPASSAAAPYPSAGSAPSATPVAEGHTGPTATPIQVLPPQRPRTSVAAAAVPDPAATGAAQGAGSLFQPGGVGRTDTSDGPVPSDATSGASAVTVQPPSRPGRIGQRIAATNTVAELPGQDGDAASAANRTYAVQLAVRPTEDAARTAYGQLSDKFANDLGGKPATVTQAQVNGRSVFRVRVTPLSREDANTLCTRLKSSGGQCFVVAN